MKILQSMVYPMAKGFKDVREKFMPRPLGLKISRTSALPAGIKSELPMLWHRKTCFSLHMTSYFLTKWSMFMKIDPKSTI